MAEMSQHGKVGLAALRAGMDRKTARRYLEAGKLPSSMKEPRGWRTRKDPFERDWEFVEQFLVDAPELEAKTIFDYLVDQHPDRYEEGQLRTLQRKIKRWRARQGPPKEVFFPQEHRPGEAMQTDFTTGATLGVTIADEPFAHLLCHCALPYSNWESATVCSSESMAAVKRGVQTALFRLGRVPIYHQTDHSTAATHREIGTAKGRRFNKEYQDFCDHFAMTPRTTQVGAKEQNGDVESANGVFKRRLRQRLILRGSCDFASVEEYEIWLWERCQDANQLRSVRLAKELSVMKELPVSRIVEYSPVRVRVTSASTVRVKGHTYSVPSQLIGEWVEARVYDRLVEVFFAGEMRLRCDRLRGESRHRIQYHHVIHSLVRKPGAFARYRYREDLFPDQVFRRAHEALSEALPERKADLHYLRILQLAAETRESTVRTALWWLEEQKTLPLFEAVEARVEPVQPEVPDLPEIPIDLAVFDELLTASEVEG
jgi:hypothetical protein